jgi:nitrite reductase/ring-hydroxylating ferredoxin subunit
VNLISILLKYGTKTTWPKKNPFLALDYKGRILELQEGLPHTVSEVMCVKCRQRWIAIRPSKTLLKELECPKHHVGFVIETGQVIDEEGIG